MDIFRFRRLTLATSLSLAAATAVSAQESTATPATPPSAPAATPAAEPAKTGALAARRPRRDRNKITAEELAGRTEADLFSYLQGARPQWLRARGKGSINLNEQVWVYRDGVKIGGVGALRQIRMNEIREIQHMEGTQATQRYGLDHGAGAIFVLTR
jgi:hypothetical protein